MKSSEILRLAERDLPRKRCAHPRRHALVCATCRHPGRAAIDRDIFHAASAASSECILDRRNPPAIVSRYTLRSPNAGYRRGRATGLWALCLLALSPLERLIEHVDEIRPTARATACATVRAVRMYAGLPADQKPSSLTAANPSNVAFKARRRGPRSSPHARYTPPVAVTQTPANQRDARC